MDGTIYFAELLAAFCIVVSEINGFRDLNIGLVEGLSSLTHGNFNEHASVLLY